MASLLRRVRRADGCRPTPTASGCARAAQAQDRRLQGDRPRGPAARPPGDRADRRRGARRGLDARGRLDLGRGVGPRGARARRRRRASPRASPSSPATSSRPRSPTRRSTCWRSSELGVDPDDAIVVEDSRNGLLAAVGAGPALRRHGQQLHGDEDMSRGGARRDEPRRPRRARARARQPQRGATGRPGHARRPRGRACSEPAANEEAV